MGEGYVFFHGDPSGVGQKTGASHRVLIMMVYLMINMKELIIIGFIGHPKIGTLDWKGSVMKFGPQNQP